MIWISLALVGIGFLISLPLCGLLVQLGHHWQLLDRIGSEAHKQHARVVPNTGGIAIFIAIALPTLGALLAVWLVPEGFWASYLPAILPHLPGLRQMTPIGGGVLAAVGLMHLLGLFDDRRPLGPRIKLTAQAAIAIALVLLCDMRILRVLDHWAALGTGLSVVLSVAWIIVIINAFNFLDNMDGLSAGVGAIIAALYLAATLIAGQWFVAGLAGLTLGALIGFLVLNFPPARLFMGDGGSLVLGVVLAVISVRTTYFEGVEAVPAVGAYWYGVLMPAIVMAVPLYDFVSVTLIRLVQGRSPFSGDHSHFSHRLVKRGLTRRRAVLVIWLCTLATGISGVMLGQLLIWQAILALAQTAAVLTLLALLEHGAAYGRVER